MVGTIVPIVHGNKNNGSCVLGLHIAAYILGASMLGILLGSFSLLFTTAHHGRWSFAVIGAASLVCSLRELGLIRLPLPEVRWQVPRVWQKFSPNTMATLYGLVLGFGVANRIRVSTFHIAVLWAVLSGNPLLAGCVLSAFGLGRAMPLLWMTRCSKTASGCFQIAESTGHLFPIVRAVSGLGLAFVGSCFLVTWLTR